MRRSAVALIFALGMGFVSQSSLAADMPLKAPAAAPVSLYNWSGFYVGGNLGYGWSDASWENGDNTSSFGDYPSFLDITASHDMSGVIGGGQIGYNYQTGPWVLGVEAMFDGASIKGSFSSNKTPFSLGGDDQFEARIKALMLFTGRVGYASDNILAYGKAGVGVANIRAEVSDDVGAFTGSGSDSHWLTGPTVGVGLEYGITPNLSIGVEYDYLYLKSATYQLGDATGSYSWDVDVRNVNLVMAKLNYRFNWPR